MKKYLKKEQALKTLKAGNALRDIRELEGKLGAMPYGDLPQKRVLQQHIQMLKDAVYVKATIESGRPVEHRNENISWFYQKLGGGDL